MDSKETSNNSKRFWSWLAFALIIGLIIWGLIAAQQKADREGRAVLLPTEIVATDHIRGGVVGTTTTPITLVEYGDFQCPACRTYHPIVEQVIASTSLETLRFVFRHFPLTTIHANAIPAARASEAASSQGKFWEMYNLLYDKQPDWETSSDAKTIFIRYAKDLGLNEKKFLEDYDSKAVMDTINNDYKGGIKAGINSTPTFFVNGAKINNPQSYDEFKKIIDDSIPKISF